MKSDFYKAPLTETQKTTLGKVGVLLGGRSAEREISLKSGTAVLEALRRANVNVVGIDIGDNALQQIQQENLDKVFIMLHGIGGEDGRIQALLSYLHLPFTGSACAASALALDKLRSKQLWRGINLPTPEFAVLQDGSDWQTVLQQLGGKVMVKPCHEGSSLGMSRADSADSLQQAYATAKKFDRSVIAEALIDGTEYSVSILGVDALPAIELKAKNVFYDYEAKYFSDETQYLCPAPLSAKKTAELSELALLAFNSLGCSGWGRVDIMADAQQNFYVLEVNTVPGMTDHSLVPMAAKAVGISMEDLVLKILQLSDL